MSINQGTWPKVLPWNSCSNNPISDLEEVLSRIVIRQITPEDQAVSRNIILRGLGEHFDRVDPTLNPDLDDIVSAYSASGHIFVVATIEELIVGTGGLRIVNTQEGRIVRLSVIRELRGHGIGQAIVTYLLNMARELSLRRIHVETNRDWYPAIGLYDHCGFIQLYADDESVHMALDLS